MSETPKLPVVASSPSSRHIRAELLALGTPHSSRHLVQFYDDDAFMIETVALVAAKTLSGGDSSVIIATHPHLPAIKDRLRRAGLNPDAPGVADRCVMLDAGRTLSRFLVNGWPDEDLFRKVIGGIVERAAEKGRSGFVLCFGEMVALLCAAAKPDAAVFLEKLANSLAESRHVSVICAYPLTSISADPGFEAIFKICAEHALVIPAESPI